MPRDKSASHIKIMAAAKAEFLEMGYENASMRSIGNRCQMTAAGIYRHCKDKEDLFYQLVSPAEERLEKDLHSTMASGATTRSFCPGLQRRAASVKR